MIESGFVQMCVSLSQQCNLKKKTILKICKNLALKPTKEIHPTTYYLFNKVHLVLGISSLINCWSIFLWFFSLYYFFLKYYDLSSFTIESLLISNLKYCVAKWKPYDSLLNWSYHYCPKPKTLFKLLRLFKTIRLDFFA